MRTHEHRRHDRHDAETPGCQRPGHEDRQAGQDEDRGPRDEDRSPRDGSRRRGYGPGEFPGWLSAGPPGFRRPAPRAGGPRMRGPRAQRGAGIELRTLAGQLAMAAFQVGEAGTDPQQEQARKILAGSRDSLDRILASSQDEASADEASAGER
jgi:hypothetical protein